MSTENTAADFTRHAAQTLQWAQDNMGLSLLELSAVFRISANACDEAHKIYEQAQLAAKVRNWKPGT